MMRGMIQRLMMCVTGLVIAVSASAQDAEQTGGLIIPESAREPAVAPWIAAVVLMALILLVAIASFKSAKRSTQG
jgi:hypothetical protein